MIRLAAAGMCVLAGMSISRAEDWPTYQHDSQRSACSGENLAAAGLRPDWVYRSPGPPRPAWDGAARWDAYAGIRPLKSMREYDPVYHVSVAGRSLYFGSSADDTVRCLDTRSGKEQWTYTTDGAVRIAPAYANGRVYFGSDDGYAYCLDAIDGRLIWKFQPSPTERLILHNGRFIPFWPCRTGVLVDGGTAYFAVGMLPWKESYLCAVDALTGKPEGLGRYVRRLEAVTLEGAMLASSKRLISPQGRVAPLLFSRQDGAPLGGLQGGGGCFVLVTPDEHVLHGPGNKTGWIQESSERDRSKIATFNGGNALVVKGDTSYVLTDAVLMAMDRTSRKEIWSQPNRCTLAVIAGGEVLYAGGDGRVAAYRASDGQRLWEGPVAGRAYGLAVADGALFVSTDEGVIQSFRAPPPAVSGEVAARAGEPTPAASMVREEAGPPVFAPPNTVEFGEGSEGGKPPRSVLAQGPWLKFEDPERAVIWWQTAKPTPTVVEWGRPGAESQEVGSSEPTTNHTMTLTGLRRNRAHYYIIKGLGEGQPDEKYECDSFFNYSAAPMSSGALPFPADDKADFYAASARAILAESGTTQGICLVLGVGEGRLAYELARQSRLEVVGVDTDLARVQAAREALRRGGAYGLRVTVRHVSSLSNLPFTGGFANLIVAGGDADGSGFPVPAAELCKYLRPYGGVALMGQPSNATVRLAPDRLEAWLAPVAKAPGLRVQARDQWAEMIRGATPGGADWSHEYGDASNAAFAGEDLHGAGGTADLEVQWLGKPGPRAQADRNGRKPSPLSTRGRLFVQGLHRVIALDACNGTILWSREIPPLQRFNMPRDSSNWCADAESLYLAINGACWQLDAATGDLVKTHPVLPGDRSGRGWDWSFVSIQGSRLVGSAARPGAAYTEYWGGKDAGWYDATNGPATDKVCSENLFALDRRSGQRLWEYTGGRIINSTISIGDNQVYFIQSTQPKVMASETGRIGLPELWREPQLVALALDSGRQLWVRPIAPAAGEVAAYLALGSGKLVLVCSGGKNYNVYAYDSRNGDQVWETTFPWPSDNHGGHMARPAVVGGKVYVRPRVFELGTGKMLEETVPGGGCGTYAATAKALIFRNGNVTLWGLENNQTTSWERLRPDCWLSTIPAQGLLLSPEAGGGCSCGSWMETSIAFAPRAESLVPAQP